MTAFDRSPPLTTFPPIFASTIIFLTAWTLLRRYTTTHGPNALFISLMRLNNQFYTIICIILSYLLINTYIPSTTPLHIDRLPSSTTLGLFYHYTKFYEYLDIFLLVGSGHPIGWHMTIHHITTPYLTFFRIICLRFPDHNDADPTASFRAFALCNAIHHTLLYAYFGGMVGPFNGTRAIHWRKVTRVTGYIQLLVGLGVEIEYFRRVWGMDEALVPEEAIGRLVSAVLLSTYFRLFTSELIQGSRQKRSNLVNRDGELKKEE